MRTLDALQSGEWIGLLRGDPLDWLLASDTPAVRHLALQWLLDMPADDAAVRTAQRAAMRTNPIAAILHAQHPEGYWEKPGPGYATKYRGTVWQLMFLDQLGADPEAHGHTSEGEGTQYERCGVETRVHQHRQQEAACTVVNPRHQDPEGRQLSEEQDKRIQCHEDAQRDLAGVWGRSTT